MRRNSTNEFESNFYKLVCNSLYGKSIEQKRNHRQVELALNETNLKNLIKQPNFKKFTIIGEDNVLCELNKTKVR